MITYKGRSVYEGIAIGRLAVYRKRKRSLDFRKAENPESELERFWTARAQAADELTSLYHRTVKELGESEAGIFEAHRLMAEDMDYAAEICQFIENEQAKAEYAVASVGERFAAMFGAMEDVYMRERAADVRDVSDRIVAILCGETEEVIPGEGEVILLADDLAPSETVQLDKSRILAFVTRRGSANSHTAILARTMNIPALLGVDYPDEIDGREGILDGYEGILYVEPEAEVRAHFLARKQADEEKKKQLRELFGKENETLDGHRIDVYANIGGIADAKLALANDAGGIGLLRSEFLYLEARNYPGEEEQFHVYRTVAELMEGRRVIIRTMDIGADKQASYFGLEKEENPALGYRAIRICLERKELFKTQLRAIFRAGCYGQVAIMLPMITSVEEVREAKALAEEAKQELTEGGLPFSQVELGIMIETPAAALISDLLAKEVDFFSIGTNDLTQYTLAADRQNPRLERYYKAYHEAVLRLIRLVVENGHREGCPVGICGEMAADRELTEFFLRLGVDELSVPPSLVLPLREKIRSLRLEER